MLPRSSHAFNEEWAMSTENPYDTPPQASSVITPQPRQLTLKRIDVLSAANVLGALYLMIGLLIGAVFAMLSLVRIAANNGGGATAFLGIGAIIFMPLFYGVLGFIGGAIGAVIYNVVAGVVGGVKMDFE